MKKDIHKRGSWTAPGPSKYDLGKPVESIRDLYDLATRRKAVYITFLRRHQPAAVTLHMQCIAVIRMINKEQIIIINDKQNGENKKEQ